MVEELTGRAPGGAVHPRAGGYRPDLDGLRGAAVALVAIFHVWFGRVSGGVDIFLVLSGYFLGATVVRAVTAAANQSAWPLEQLRRLALRLVPALVVVLASCAALTVLIQPSTRWESFADQSLACLGFFQNLHLIETSTGYAAAGVAVSPLQHLWSISVQGQFYVGFIVLAAVVSSVARGFRKREYVAAVLTAMTVVFCGLSFALALSARTVNASAAYYNTYARSWELLLGVLVALAAPYLSWPRRARAAAAIAALGAVVCCGAMLDGARQFPGPWTLIPTGAAVVLILSGNGGAENRPIFTARLLSSGPLVALGAMAYSLYLWHWPVLIFWLVYARKGHAGLIDGLGVLLISGLLAYVTTRFIEAPFRTGSRTTASASAVGPRRVKLGTRSRMLLGAAVVLLAVAVTASAVTWRKHLTAERALSVELVLLPVDDYPGAKALISNVPVPQRPLRPSVWQVKQDLPITTISGCISDFSTAALVTCTLGDPEAERTIAVAGASHAEHWLPALEQLGHQHSFKIVTYLKMGCPLSTDEIPVIAISQDPYPQCHEWVQTAMPQLIADHPDYVFTTTTRPRLDQDGDFVPESYLGIWDQLSTNDIGMLGIRDTPWLTRGGQPLDPADCLTARGNHIHCGIDRSSALNERNPTLDLIQHYPRVKALDLSDAVCDALFCPAVSGNVLIYRDSNHLSATYVRTMTEELGRQIAQATAWW